MQEKAFERTGLPLCYVMGNHELDYSRAKEHEQEPVFLPFYEMVKGHEGWYTTPSYTDPYFKISLGDFKVYFFSDHIAEFLVWTGTTFLKSMYPVLSIYVENSAEACFYTFMRIIPLASFSVITMHRSFQRFIFLQRKSR